MTVKIINKPWGYEEIWAHTDKYVGKILHINQGEKLSLQYHKIKEETIMVLRGELLLHLRWDENITGPRVTLTSHQDPETGEYLVATEKEDQTERILSLREKEIYHIDPGVIHRMEAVTDCEIMEVSTPELDDVVRLEDKYGRAGINK